MTPFTRTLLSALTAFIITAGGAWQAGANPKGALALGVIMTAKDLRSLFALPPVDQKAP